MRTGACSPKARLGLRARPEAASSTEGFSTLLLRALLYMVLCSLTPTGNRSAILFRCLLLLRRGSSIAPSSRSSATRHVGRPIASYAVRHNIKLHGQKKRRHRQRRHVCSLGGVSRRYLEHVREEVQQPHDEAWPSKHIGIAKHNRTRNRQTVNPLLDHDVVMTTRPHNADKTLVQRRKANKQDRPWTREKKKKPDQHTTQ